MLIKKFKANNAKLAHESSGFMKLLVLSVMVIGLAYAGRVALLDHMYNKIPTEHITITKPKAKTTTTTTAAATVNPCASNTLDQLVLVSISQRHLWACNEQTVAYNSPVITGMAFLAADLTPTGTYHIYAKSTDVYLKGSDSTGSWDDFVNYWMPFLDNQYGAYGFHDATWRPSNAFGNVSDESNNASHGCVECPLATAAWLYAWTKVGTTVTIEA